MRFQERLDLLVIITQRFRLAEAVAFAFVDLQRAGNPARVELFKYFGRLRRRNDLVAVAVEKRKRVLDAVEVKDR